jgi:prohibitin 1
MKTLIQHVGQMLTFTGLTGLLFMQSCTTIHPGEIAVKVVRGKLKPDNYLQGRHAVGFGRHYVKFNTRIRELSMQMTLPTKEGLEAKTDISLLYHIKPEAIHEIFLTLGLNYEKSIIMSNFAATARETCLNYRAMDLMVQRDSLEKSIFDNMNHDISHYGFVIDQVLVKDIDVPDEIDKAIEKKVLSEQQAKQQEVDILIQKRITESAIDKQRKEMEFAFEKQTKEKEASIVQERLEEDYALERQKKEAERSVIEAQALKKAQEYTNSTITELLIKYKTVEAMKAFADSPNAKLIITDGKTPITLKEFSK